MKRTIEDIERDTERRIKRDVLSELVEKVYSDVVNNRHKPYPNKNIIIDVMLTSKGIEKK